MQIASIVLPKVGNNGENIDAAHKALRIGLCKAFGGYTAVTSFGGWVADNGDIFEEEGFTYQIACNPGEETNAAIRALAIEAGHNAKQLAMFVTFPGGNVEIIETEQKESNAC